MAYSAFSVAQEAKPPSGIGRLAGHPLAPAVVGGVLGLLGTYLQNRGSARAAKEQRSWEERMSSTAHEREVRDLRNAGLNPMMAMMRGGASTPSGAMAQVGNLGEGLGRGIASAMVVKQLGQIDAQTAHINAQAHRERSTAALQDTQSMALGARAPLELALLQGDIKMKDLSVQERQAMVPYFLEKAKQEMQLLYAGVRGAKASAMLEEAAVQGALNIEAFEKRIGSGGPMLKLFFEALRSGAVPFTSGPGISKPRR